MKNNNKKIKYKDKTINHMSILLKWAYNYVMKTIKVKPFTR